MPLISGMAPQLPSPQARNPSVSHTLLPHLSIFTNKHHQLLSLLLPPEALDLPILHLSMAPPARFPPALCNLPASRLTPYNRPHAACLPHLLLTVSARLPILQKVKSKVLSTAFKATQILSLKRP